jgi:hypothetical protein
MPPEGYNAITVSDEVFKRITEVTTEYNCNSTTDAVRPRRLSHSNMMK